MERYVRVEQSSDESTPVSENEVRIMASGKMRSYITYATSLLMDKGYSQIVLKAMGRASNKLVTVCEITKRRILGLHQLAEIGSIDVQDVWEPLEEGLTRLETTRHVSVITITLSKEPLDPELPGYQAPLPESMVKPLQEAAEASHTGVTSGAGEPGMASQTPAEIASLPSPKTAAEGSASSSSKSPALPSEQAGRGLGAGAAAKGGSGGIQE